MGLNASHMVGPHHVLFEGNYGFNWDSDKTHGNAIYHTIFRNHLRGIRAFDDRRADGANGLRATTRRAAYLLLLEPSSATCSEPRVRWRLGLRERDDGPAGDLPARLGRLGALPHRCAGAATTIRHGNFDYVTNSVKWDPSIATQSLPSSLYLSGRPAFFDAGHGYTWPWVDPTGSTKLYTLPAKARYDAGTPFTQP